MDSIKVEPLDIKAEPADIKLEPNLAPPPVQVDAWDKPTTIYEKDLPGGWHKKIIQRGKPKNEAPKSKGRATDAYLIAPNKKRLRSSNDLLVFITDHPDYWEEFDPLVHNFEQPHKTDPATFSFGTKKVIKFFEDIRSGVDIEEAKASALEPVVKSRANKKEVKKFNESVSHGRPTMVDFMQPTPLMAPFLGNYNLPPLKPIIINPSEIDTPQIQLPLPFSPIQSMSPKQENGKGKLSNRLDVISEFEHFFAKKCELPSSTQMLAWSKQFNVQYGDIARWFLKRWKNRLTSPPSKSKSKRAKMQYQLTPHHLKPVEHIEHMVDPQDEIAESNGQDDNDDDDEYYNPALFCETELVEVEGDTLGLVSDIDTLETKIEPPDEETAPSSSRRKGTPKKKCSKIEPVVGDTAVVDPTECVWV